MHTRSAVPLQLQVPGAQYRGSSWDDEAGFGSAKAMTEEARPRAATAKIADRMVDDGAGVVENLDERLRDRLRAEHEREKEGNSAIPPSYRYNSASERSAGRERFILTLEAIQPTTIQIQPTTRFPGDPLQTQQKRNERPRSPRASPCHTLRIVHTKTPSLIKEDNGTPSLRLGVF